MAYLSLITATVCIWVSLTFLGVLDGIEEETLRWRYLVRGERQSKAPIIYVDLDAETVSYMGDRPWDRREFGVLLHALLGAGDARVISIDIILSKFGAGALLDLERAHKGDGFMGEAVRAYGQRVVLAAAYTGVKTAYGLDTAYLPLIRNENYAPKENPFPEAPTFPIIQFDVGRLGLANVDEELSGGTIPYFVPGFVELDSYRYSFHLIEGLRRFKESFMNEPFPKVIGDEVVLTDKDGFTTDVLPMQHQMTIFSLGLETFLASYGLDDNSVEISPEALIIRSQGEVFRRVPLVDQQSIEVNWLQAWDSTTQNNRISMQVVLRNADALAAASAADDADSVAELEAWFARFKDKVILVGAVDPLLKDISPTPFNREPVPKVGLHANLYRTIEDEAYILRVQMPVRVGIITLLTLSVSLLALGSGVPRILSILLLIGYGALNFVVFAQFNWILPLVAPIGSTLTASLFVVLLKLGSEEWQRRRIKTLFGAYVSPKLVDEIVESNQDPKLGGAEAEVTALFSDVEGFSTLSEELSPDQLVSLMNEYLGAMTEVFQSQAGTLDKYVGDAIVTMFGMPLPVKDHALRGCLSALEMQERHAVLRAKWAQSGKWPESVLNMRTRIGLNTGDAVIGNMGSEMRFNYTMMGDSVNLAARCESGGKIYGVYTMVTETTLQAALAYGAELDYRKLDCVVVKGRHQSVELYELWDSSIDHEATAACKAAYEAALAHYFEGDWAVALEAFEASEILEPSIAFAPTTPSTVLAARCRQFISEGDPENWDGAFTLTSK
jgi:adenylate cyclase